MSRLTVGILGAVTLSLISGAAQFALGRDLPLMRGAVDQGDGSQSQLSAGIESGMVNRGSKSDRAAGYAGAAMQSKTISLRLEGFSDTSFLLRIPAADGSSSLVPPKPPAHKPVIACEAMVSVLTEIARQLPPGRCVA